MRRFFTFLFVAMASVAAWADDFVKGADVSWCTEMEADGQRFSDADGSEADIFGIVKSIGMGAVRLRVWVDPVAGGYGPYCNLQDVLVKARRARSQGLDIMIDFHYSDVFTDPGAQATPSQWQGSDLAQLASMVAAHTTAVLQSLKNEGIEPKWVQVGNETNNGMLWPVGKIDWDKSGADRYASYVALSNAGYDAVKGVLPEVKVVVHIANAYNAGNWDGWFFKDFIASGGKLDMIGLSHYPDYDRWDSTDADAVSNANAAASVATLSSLYGVPVMICETGFSNYDTERASAVMSDLLRRMKAQPGCAGVFYWEPEADGIWKPGYYNKVGWGAYTMGAFAGGRPTAALDAFSEADGSIAGVEADLPETDAEWFDLTGRRIAEPSAAGLYVRRIGTAVEKVRR